MKRKLIFFILAVMYFGCNDVRFERDPEYTPKCQNSGLQCTELDGIDKFDYSMTIGKGAVDIIFVDDNSGSMSTEQKNMGDHFPDFIDSLSDLDYHIGIITTDVSSAGNEPREINGFGALQDGNFLKFDDGSYYLTSDSSDVADLFSSTIKRQETLDCENELDQTGKKTDSALCPSMDERGIYAAILSLDKLPSGFIRTHAHLAVIILSDEDERSTGGKTKGYKLEANDEPQSLVDKVEETFGTGKTFSVHAVIVKPGDSSCLNVQESQTHGVKGHAGNIYSDLVDLTSGVLGSVCAADWGRELGEIAYGVEEDVKQTLSIACSDPIDNEISIEFEFLESRDDIGWSFDSSERVVRFDEALPPGTKVHLKYECTSL